MEAVEVVPVAVDVVTDWLLLEEELVDWMFSTTGSITGTLGANPKASSLTGKRSTFFEKFLLEFFVVSGLYREVGLDTLFDL